jgi:hypothetical protein
VEGEEPIITVFNYMEPISLHNYNDIILMMDLKNITHSLELTKVSNSQTLKQNSVHNTYTAKNKLALPTAHTQEEQWQRQECLCLFKRILI